MDYHTEKEKSKVLKVIGWKELTPAWYNEMIEY
jgi:hypothetical protein